MKITWSKRSISDIDNIYNYIKLDSHDNAKDFISEIRNKVNVLSEFPEIGRVSLSSSLENNLKEFVIHKNYVVTYILKKEEVEILQIWHVARSR